MNKRTKELPVQKESGEPWVYLPTGADLEGWSAEDRVQYNQYNRQSAKLSFYIQAFDFITDNRIVGDYHEYGCHRVRTFRMALSEARRHNLDTMRFHAFDSFEGLPHVTSDTSVEIWKKGALTTSEEQFKEIVKGHGIYVNNILTNKGFYDKSLTVELQQKYLKGEKPVAFACIDCDLYESAVPVFNFIEPLLQEGTIVYLDDYYAGYKGSPRKGVAGAFAEFQARSRFKYEPFLPIGWFGKSFITYAG